MRLQFRDQQNRLRTTSKCNRRYGGKVLKQSGCENGVTMSGDRDGCKVHKEIANSFTFGRRNYGVSSSSGLP
jgi:hypothetical protein